MNTNFRVVGLTRLGIKLESTVSEAGALTTRTSELLFQETGFYTGVGDLIFVFH